MKTRPIILTCITLCFVGLCFLAEVRGRMNGAQEHQRVAEFWKSQVGKQQLKKLVVLGRFADFKQEVASLLPEKFPQGTHQSEKQRIRDLASVIPHESQHSLTLGYSAKRLMNLGKKEIQNRKFKSGMKWLDKLIHQFPDSHHVVEAHYLMIEALYQSDKNEKVVEWVEKMVELFPESRLTGFAMLKVGNIYELESRHEDAIQVYKTIVSAYKDKALVSQAQVAIQELEL